MRSIINQNAKKGFATLVSVIIIGAVALSISVSVLITSIDVTRKNLANQNLYIAKNLANACAERALDKLRQNLTYAGNETITFPNGSCQILAVLGSGNTNRTVQTSGTSGNIIRKIKVIIAQVSPLIQITSWHEVADF